MTGGSVRAALIARGRRLLLAARLRRVLPERAGRPAARAGRLIDVLTMGSSLGALAIIVRWPWLGPAAPLTCGLACELCEVCRRAIALRA